MMTPEMLLGKVGLGWPLDPVSSVAICAKVLPAKLTAGSIHNTGYVATCQQLRHPQIELPNGENLTPTRSGTRHSLILLCEFSSFSISELGLKELGRIERPCQCEAAQLPVGREDTSRSRPGQSARHPGFGFLKTVGGNMRMNHQERTQFVMFLFVNSQPGKLAMQA